MNYQSKAEQLAGGNRGLDRGATHQVYRNFQSASRGSEAQLRFVKRLAFSRFGEKQGSVRC